MTATMPARATQAPRFGPVPAIPRDPGARDHGWPQRWPHRSCLELAALNTAPGCARRHACALLQEWDLNTITDETALIVSELATNAVRSTRACKLDSPVRLWVLGDAARVLLLIWDATVAPPAPADAAPRDEGGRGLALVDALSHRWGWYHPDRAPAGTPGGKVVWALIQAPAVPGGAR